VAGHGIIEMKPVMLPRPRQPEMMFSEPFTSVKRRCFDLIRAEGAKNFQERKGVSEVIGLRR
jgi:hypothetical protein